MTDSSVHVALADDSALPRDLLLRLVRTGVGDITVRLTGGRDSDPFTFTVQGRGWFSEHTSTSRDEAERGATILAARHHRAIADELGLYYDGFIGSRPATPRPSEADLRGHRPLNANGHAFAEEPE